MILDFLVRAWRIQWIMQGLGTPLPLRDAFVVNAFGDAANALTPLRLGGEPARVAGMLRTGVRMTAALVGITLEAVVSRLVLIAVAAWLIWKYAPAWWVTAGPGLRSGATKPGPGCVLVLVVGILLWRYTQRAVSPASRRLRRPAAAGPGVPEADAPLAAGREPSSERNRRWPPASRSFRCWPSPCRAHRRMGPVIFGSFALLYSQMVLPTPSGAGVVELGFLGGAAGQLGEGQGWILLAWRFYTNGLGVVAGCMAGAQHLWLAGAAEAPAREERCQSPSERTRELPGAAQSPPA